MNRTLLLIDNTAALPVSIRHELVSHDWAVIEATTAEAAFEVATRQRPDAILLNGSMAHLNAEEFALKLKWDPLTCTIPILVFTPLQRAQARPSQIATETLPWPLEWPLLGAKLQQCLARWKRHQPCVLVVDDEPDLVEIMLHVLDHEGFLATGAFDGRQALEIAKAIHPDAILLDLDMPRLDGWEVLKQLKQDTVLSSIHVIILTGVAKTDQDRQGGLSRGADAYLYKPCPVAEVVRTLQAVL